MSPVQLEVSQYEKRVAEEKPEVTQFSLIQFLREVRAEYLKISWPSREQVVREFFAVVLLVAIIAGIIFLIDRVLGIVLNFFTGGFIY